MKGPLADPDSWFLGGVFQVKVVKDPIHHLDELAWPLFSHRALVESCKLKGVLRSGQGTVVTNEFITCIAVECDELRIFLIDWVALWRIVKRLL